MTKNGNKVWTIWKTKMSPLCKLSPLCYHFLSHFENENIFFYIPCYPPPIAVRNSLTNQFFQKNWRFCILKKKKMQNWREEKGHFSFWIVQTLLKFFVKFWILEINFFISIAIPLPSRSGIHWPINFSKKSWCFFIFSTKKIVTIYVNFWL